MKRKLIGLLIITGLMSACVSIPQETITLSQTLGKDLKALHKAHLNFVEIYFGKIQDEINEFIDDVYAPFIIHYVLKKELTAYKAGQPSIYGTIELAGKVEGKTEAMNAINEMNDFQLAARKQIEKRRKELLAPILKQEKELTETLEQSYKNTIYANATITAYLKSIKKVKETQQEALSLIGLDGIDDKVNNTLTKISEEVEKAVEMGKDIDVKSDDAYQKIEKITKQIKDITNKN